MGLIDLLKKKNEIQVTEWLKPREDAGKSCYGDYLSNEEWIRKEVKRIGKNAFIKTKYNKRLGDVWAIFCKKEEKKPHRK